MNNQEEQPDTANTDIGEPPPLATEKEARPRI